MTTKKTYAIYHQGLAQLHIDRGLAANGKEYFREYRSERAADKACIALRRLTGILYTVETI